MTVLCPGTDQIKRSSIQTQSPDSRSRYCLLCHPKASCVKALLQTAGSSGSDGRAMTSVSGTTSRLYSDSLPCQFSRNPSWKKCVTHDENSPKSAKRLPGQRSDSSARHCKPRGDSRQEAAGRRQGRLCFRLRWAIMLLAEQAARQTLGRDIQRWAQNQQCQTGNRRQDAEHRQETRPSTGVCCSCWHCGCLSDAALNQRLLLIVWQRASPSREPSGPH
jgi:hypothetical protein